VPRPPTPDPSPPFAAQTGGGEEESIAQAAAAQLARLTALAAAIDEQIAVVRAKQMLPQSPDEARDLTRTLESLTAGASHIHHLLHSLPQGARADDAVHNSNSSDLDARRDALARRIDAILAEWMDAAAHGHMG
jgi:hypothetical protein